MAVTLTQLTAFLAVVRTGSVRAAAEELVVTQPSVSAAIAALAGEIGAGRTARPVRGAGRGGVLARHPSVSAAMAALSRELAAALRERSGRSVRPSAAGEAFAPY